MKISVSLHEFGSSVEFFNLPINELRDWVETISEYNKRRVQEIKKASRKR